jgi:hypothetical protein
MKGNEGYGAAPKKDCTVRSPISLCYFLRINHRLIDGVSFGS